MSWRADITGASAGPSLRSALLTLGTILLIILTVVAGVVFFPQLQAGSTAAWTVALILFVALAELIAANVAAAPRNAGKPRPGGLAGGTVRLALRVVLVFLVVAAAWAFIAGGVADRIGASLTAQFDSPVELASQPTDPGVIVAKRRLKQVAPRVYKSASNINSPSIHPQTEGRISYTWSYVPQGSSVPASFTLTLDVEGKVVAP